MTPRRAAQARTRWIAAAIAGVLGLVAVTVVALSLRASPEPATTTGTATPLADTSPSAPAATPTATPSTTSPPAGDASEPVRSTALAPPPSNAPDPNETNEANATASPVEPAAATSTSDDSTASAGRSGRLHVATPGGWALVFRGRARLGESPGTFTLPAGAHEIGLQPFGEGPIRRRRVVIPSGGTTRLSIPIR